MNNQIQEFKNAIEQDPNNINAYADWRMAIAALENPDTELKEYEKTIKKNLDTADAYNDLGLLLHKLEKYGEAIKQYKKAIEKESDYTLAYNNWGSALLSLGDYEQAIEQYKKALEKNPNYADVYNNCGIALHKIRKYDEAIEQYKKAIEKDPDYADVYNNWGLALKNLGEYEKAIEQYKKALEKNPGFALAYNNWGNALLNLEEYEKAIKQFEKVIELDPDYADAYYNRGNALLSLGDYEQAIEQYKKVIEMEPDYADAYYNCGNVFLSRGEYDKAIEQYKKSIEADPKNAWAIHNWAYVLGKQGQFKLSKEKWRETCLAYENLKKDAQQAKDALNFLYQGSIYHYELKELEQAKKIYDEGLNIDSENTAILINLVDLFFEMKDETIGDEEETRNLRNTYYWQAQTNFRNAENLLKKKLENKEEASTLLDMGRLYLVIKDYGKSKEYLSKALNKDNRLSDAALYLGVIHVREEKFKEAISYFKDALRFDHDNLNTRSNLAEAYLKANYKDKAETEYREILEIAPCHLDSLIGLGEVYAAMGEDAKKRNDSGEAELMFSRALYFYSETLKLDRKGSGNASKKLNKTELSALFYSKGYSKVLLYESQSGKNDKLLHEAKEDFNEIYHGTSNYYKARRAVDKIDERIAPSDETGGKWGHKIVFCFALIVFILAQFSFFIGKPIFKQSGILVDSEKLKDIMERKGLDDSILLKVKGLINQTFYSPAHFYSEFEERFGDKLTSEIKKHDLLHGSGKIEFKGFKHLEAGYYALLTFAALIFMVAGLFLQQISRLKFGAMELEKSTLDQITTSTSLGIHR